MQFLENIKPGDTVVIDYASFGEKYTIAKVGRVTKTQITVGRNAFMKRTGLRVGDRGSWHPSRIVDIPVEEALQANADAEAEAEARRLARKIADSYRHISQLSVETLQEAVRVLGLEAAK